MSSMQSVPAVQYECKVYQGMMDAVHGGGEVIQEIFIPSHKVIINSKGGFFYAEKPRNEQSLYFGGPKVVKPLKKIQMPMELVEKIALVAKLQICVHIFRN